MSLADQVALIDRGQASGPWPDPSTPAPGDACAPEPEPVPTIPREPRPRCRRKAALYVATDLRSWETEEPRRHAADVDIDGTDYRRLNRQYYAWLRRMMDRAMRAYDACKMSDQAFEGLCARFSVVQTWAVGQWGDRRLRTSVAAFDAKAFTLPGTARRALKVVPAFAGPPLIRYDLPRSAYAEVERIREEASALGWSEASLNQTLGAHPFPIGRDYGLVCFLRDGDRIGDVTAESIEIIGPAPQEARLRFLRRQFADGVRI